MKVKLALHRSIAKGFQAQRGMGGAFDVTNLIEFNDSHSF
jgi:hypothetical protein